MLAITNKVQKLIAKYSINLLYHTSEDNCLTFILASNILPNIIKKLLQALLQKSSRW
jgi:hypothetical protein